MCQRIFYYKFHTDIVLNRQFTRQHRCFLKTAATATLLIQAKIQALLIKYRDLKNVSVLTQGCITAAKRLHGHI